MLGGLALAFVAGLVTILNPCVLPLIPIIVSSALGKSRAGPLALAAGLVTSFTTFGFVVIAFGFSLGINEQAVRYFAGGLLTLAGVLLLIPKAQAAISAIIIMAGITLKNLPICFSLNYIASRSETPKSPMKYGSSKVIIR